MIDRKQVPPKSCTTISDSNKSKPNTPQSLRAYKDGSTDHQPIKIGQLNVHSRLHYLKDTFRWIG